MTDLPSPGRGAVAVLAHGHVRSLERLGYKVTLEPLEPLDPGTGELTAKAS